MPNSGTTARLVVPQKALTRRPAWDHDGPMPRFAERALLKVYLERADLDRLTAAASENQRLASEYVRDLVLEHLNGSGDDQPVRRAHPDGLGARRSAEPRRPSQSVSVPSTARADENDAQLTEHGITISDVPRVARSLVDGSIVKEKPTPQQAFTELERIVAGRTGHPLGCGCFQCLQTARHFTPAAAPKPTKQKGKR
jgi:hypothetical protein